MPTPSHVSVSPVNPDWPSFQDFSFVKGPDDGPLTWPIPAPPPRRTVPDARLRRLALHLFTLGPRSVFECLKAIISGAPVVATLEAYARLDPSIVKYLGGDLLSETVQ
jgi:hypothetical protein